MLDSCYLNFNQSNTTQPLIIKQRPYTTWSLLRSASQITVTVSLATCRNIMYEMEGFLHMPASHRLGFSLRNLEKVELKENPCSPRALREKDEQKRFINSGDVSLFVFWKNSNHLTVLPEDAHASVLQWDSNTGIRKKIILDSSQYGWILLWIE